MNLSAEEVVVVQKTFAQIERSRSDIMKSLMEEKNASVEIIESFYLDILLTCLISGEMFWLRRRVHGMECCDKDFVQDSEIFISQLTPMRSSCKLKSLLFNNNSIVLSVRKPVVAKLSVPSHSPHASQLESIRHSRFVQQAELVGSERSIECVVVAWVIDEELTAAAPVSTGKGGLGNAVEARNGVDALCQVVVQAVDDSRMLVLYSFTSFKAICQPEQTVWLQSGRRILIEYGSVRAYDEQFDVISVSRQERTRVTVVSCAPTNARGLPSVTSTTIFSSSTTSGSTSSINAALISNNTIMKTGWVDENAPNNTPTTAQPANIHRAVKRFRQVDKSVAAAEPPQKAQKEIDKVGLNNSFIGCLSENPQEVLDSEFRRFVAIKSGSHLFATSDGRMQSCRRKNFKNCTINIVDKSYRVAGDNKAVYLAKITQFSLAAGEDKTDINVEIIEDLWVAMCLNYNLCDVQVKSVRFDVALAEYFSTLGQQLSPSLPSGGYSLIFCKPTNRF